MPERIFVPKTSAKEVTFSDGGSLIRLGFKAKDLIEFVNQHANDRGYLNLVVSRRREPSDFGDTHSVCLDQWKPKNERAAPARQAAPDGAGQKGGDDVPF